MPPTRTYLAVPFAQHQEAKQAGARWDPKHRAWYTLKLTATLSRWLPSPERPELHNAASQASTQFAAVMHTLGLQTGHGHPIGDGHPHRVPTVDDRPGRKSGFYVLHLDGLPAGCALNHKTGERLHWHARMQLNEADRAQLRAHAAAESERRDQQQRQTQQATALRCQQHLQQLQPVPSGATTEYLQRKGVGAQTGLYSSNNGQLTHVPAYDIHGNLWTTQTIHPTGDKRFARGGKIKGCFHPLGGFNTLQRAANQGVVVLAEGYATAATVLYLAQNPDFPVAAVAAFQANNLPAVAQAIRKQYTAVPLVIAADDDHQNRINAGLHYAHIAARDTGAQVVSPPFTNEHPPQLSDWNDLDQYAQAKGQSWSEYRKPLLEALQAQHQSRSQTRPPQQRTAQRRR